MVSRTGLYASVVKADFNDINQKDETIDITGVSCNPAPIVLKPLASLYNPYPYGCSVLCNHPLDSEIKDLVKKAKDALALDPKSPHRYPDVDEINIIVPEELFRKYTETDSRATSPMPTVVQKKTPAELAIDKSRLVLDLNRSRSQQSSIKFSGVVGQDFCEALSLCHGSVLHIPHYFRPNYTTSILGRKVEVKKEVLKRRPRHQITITEKQADNIAVNLRHLDLPGSYDVQKDTEENKEVTWRRGKPVKPGKKNQKKSGKKKSGQHNKEFKGVQDPLETQVSTINQNSLNGSIITENDAQLIEEETNEEPKTSSFIDIDILKELQRELHLLDVENEFDVKKHMALQEAYKMQPILINQEVNNELEALKLKLGMNTEVILPGLPRTFSRKNIRFELPLDRKSLKDMTPLDYLRSNTSIIGSCLVIYSRVFEKYNTNLETRTIHENKLISALGEVMGRQFSNQEATDLHQMIGWSSGQILTYREWCGLCGAAERLLGHRFVPQPLSKAQDPCNEVENADFALLDRWLRDLSPDNSLYKLLTLIKNT
ncbi:uncharacterized protein LOC111028616 [Myzus persicae]|uniref:uncharacterized protein LOC111028616 n=1 Tax=Myzus persicae TaxID=13164 RepID=UPI000B939BCE|nr:uncharacterized protein LOC111028616 [Myzus persicae]